MSSRYEQLYIGGRWVEPATNTTITVVSPSTQEVVGSVPEAAERDIDADVDLGMTVARRIRTGSVGINGYLPDPTAPFGGVKASGIGREFGAEAMHSYQVFKSIYR